MKSLRALLKGFYLKSFLKREKVEKVEIIGLH